MIDKIVQSIVHPSYRATMSKVAIMIAVLVGIELLLVTVVSFSESRAISYFLPLHTLLETVSIVIAMLVFTVGWNANDRILPGNIVLLACMFFSVGWLDFFHAISFVGMPDFISSNDYEKHINFWLAARLLAAVALLVMVLMPWQPFASRKTRYVLLCSCIFFTALFSWIVIFYQDIFPHTYIKGQGLTPFKKNLEYLIIGVNVVTAALFLREMKKRKAYNVVLLFGATCIMAIGEFFFTLYTIMTDTFSLVGHFYKVISYLLIYRAVVVESIKTPYKELMRAQNNLDLAVAASGTGLWDWNILDGTTYFSPVWKAQLGYQPDELPNEFSTWRSLVHPDDLERALKTLHDFIEGNTPNKHYENEFRLRHRDGSYHWILSRGEARRDARGKVIRLLGSHIDISERKQASDRFRLAVEAAPNAMLMVDASARIVLVNDQASALFGYSVEELLGKSVHSLLPIQHRQAHEAQVKEFFQGKVDRRMGAGRELFAVCKDGHVIPVEVGLNSFETSDGRYVVATVVNIQERQIAEQKIQQLANFDSLTGLPNRALLQDQVKEAIAVAHRDGLRMATLFIDLDHFKNINDTLGHRLGDLVLIEVSRRIRAIMRDEDIVSRMGGDEYVVVMTDATLEGVARVAEKLLDSMRKSCHIELHELMVNASIGIAIYPEDGMDFDSLYQHADTAMYRAKHDGRNCYRFFTEEMQAGTARTLRLENALHYALERNQFHLCYQPQLSISDGKVIGVEALLRWTHPELGNVSPGEFIPIAETSGQIIPIGAWVLRTAVRQLKDWIEKGMQPMLMAVNLSAVQFRNVDLPRLVSQILEEEKLPAHYLELELTEGVATINPQGAIELINDLHARGVRMSIDDFGTGYSSLNYLKQFKVYKLKIDQSFVRDITKDENDRAIVSAIIHMAQSMGFKTIAEGVETEEQKAFLREQGCDEMQGYLFSRPVPAEQLEFFVKNYRSA